MDCLWGLFMLTLLTTHAMHFGLVSLELHFRSVLYDFCLLFCCLRICLHVFSFYGSRYFSHLPKTCLQMCSKMTQTCHWNKLQIHSDPERFYTPPLWPAQVQVLNAIRCAWWEAASPTIPTDYCKYLPRTKGGKAYRTVTFHVYQKCIIRFICRSATIVPLPLLL